MKTPRNVKRSFFAALETLFEGESYNVYYESDMRDEVEPTRPYIYLLDANVEFPTKRLPVVTVWWRASYRAFQMGGPSLWHFELVCDVFGNNRGEREDIAASIVEGIADSFAINDYSGSSPVAWGTASIYENSAAEYWTMNLESVGDELSVEGTLLNWASCATQFWCLPD